MLAGTLVSGAPCRPYLDRCRDGTAWRKSGTCLFIGHRDNGDSIFRYIYVNSLKELTAKLLQIIDIYRDVDLTEESKMTPSEWLDQPKDSGTAPKRF